MDDSYTNYAPRSPDLRGTNAALTPLPHGETQWQTNEQLGKQQLLPPQAGPHGFHQEQAREHRQRQQQSEQQQQAQYTIPVNPPISSYPTQQESFVPPYHQPLPHQHYPVKREPSSTWQPPNLSHNYQGSYTLPPEHASWNHQYPDDYPSTSLYEEPHNDAPAPKSATRGRPRGSKTGAGGSMRKSESGSLAASMKTERPDAPGEPEGIIIRTKFPVARIKRIVQADEDVGKVAQVTPVVVSKALELFMTSLTLSAFSIARSKNSKRITAQHLRQAVLADKQFDFLEGIIGKIQEAPAAKEGGEGASGAKRGARKKEEDSDEEMEGSASGAGNGKRKTRAPGGGRKRTGAAGGGGGGGGEDDE